MSTTHAKHPRRSFECLGHVSHVQCADSRSGARLHPVNALLNVRRDQTSVTSGSWSKLGYDDARRPPTRVTLVRFAQ